MWEELVILENYDLMKALSILDDATCHGFEFKVENHKIYYREIVD